MEGGTASPGTHPSDRLVEIRRIGRAFADITRVRILAALSGRERRLSQLIDLVGLDPTTVSRHLKLLREAGLVVVVRDGRDARVSRSAAHALLWTAIDDLASGAPELVVDAQYLAEQDGAQR